MRGKWKVIAATGIGGLAAAVLLWTALASQTGCQLQGSCDPSSAWWPGPTPTAFPNPVSVSLPSSGAIDDDTWQSNGLDDTWLFFPGGRTYTIFPFTTSDAGASPRFYGPDWDFELFVGTDPQPASTGNFTPASGNLAEVFLVNDPAAPPDGGVVEPDGGGPPGFNVSNATCADYYLRILVHRYPAGVTPGAGSAPDAGADGSVDASADAPADAAGD